MTKIQYKEFFYFQLVNQNKFTIKILKKLTITLINGKIIKI